MINVCGEIGSFGEYTNIAVCTHWAKDSWYSGGFPRNAVVSGAKGGEDSRGLQP